MKRLPRPALLALVAIGAAACAGDAPKPPKLDPWALYDSDDHTIIKKSREGVCHDWRSGNFERTTHYTAYRTIEDCEASGGRRPR